MENETVAGIPGLKDLAQFRFELRQFLSFSEAASERAGISAQQYQLMQVIGAMPPGQRASITYLAERMVLRHNSAVELVDRAERAKLVKRETDTSDLRRSLVVLTPEGMEVLHKLVAQHMEDMVRHRETIVTSLQRLGGGPKPDASEPEAVG